MNRPAPTRDARTPRRTGDRAHALARRLAAGLLCFTCAAATEVAAAAEVGPPAALAHAAALDRQIDWSQARLIAVQDAGRYKSLESFARETLARLTGRESLPGLSPAASLFEWLLRRDLHADTPIVYIGDRGLRAHLGADLSDAARARILSTGRMTPRELADTRVQQRLAELETQVRMQPAVNRVRAAQFVAFELERGLTIVPDPAGDMAHPWHTPHDLRASLPDELLASAGLSREAVGPPLRSITSDQALAVLVPWARLKRAWLAGDAAAAQSALDALADTLPQLAPLGLYPGRTQLSAEARYYAFGKFTWGYALYAVAALLSIWALVTNWRLALVTALIVTLLALAVHACGLVLRWSILGRIPVANMFEAVVASAWAGNVVALLLELTFRRRIFLLAANVTGFLALVLAAHVIPGGGTLTTLMGILDDVMLRIHTVLIILSYALIALAAVIAAAYLFGYYLVRAPRQSTTAGLLVAAGGLSTWIATGLWIYDTPPAVDGSRPPLPDILPAFSLLATVAFVSLPLMQLFPGRLRGSARWSIGVLAFCAALIALTPFAFVSAMAIIMAAGGLVWTLLTRVGRAVIRSSPEATLAPAGAAAGSSPQSVAAGPGSRGFTSASPASPAPGSECDGAPLPTWLEQFDTCHVIILHLVFVLLFVGIVLGAVWADYSWGRPWGWDPKEVFALNTWIIYVILIHVRFVTKDRALWTAWLSLGGCLMMVFNWCFVNFFVFGLHSYT